MTNSADDGNISYTYDILGRTTRAAIDGRVTDYGYNSLYSAKNKDKLINKYARMYHDLIYQTKQQKMLWRMDVKAEVDSFKEYLYDYDNRINEMESAYDEYMRWGE